MAKVIDYLLEDAAALFQTIEETRQLLAGKGFTADKEADLRSAYEEAKQKTAAQIKAAKLVQDKTGEQNRTFTLLDEYIVKVQNAAKSAYGNEKSILKKFRVGEKKANTCKALATWGEYFTGLIMDYEEVLLKNGLVQTDIAEFENRYQTFLGADAAQESAKKLKVVATMARDKASEKLKDRLNRFRSFIKSAFSSDKEIRVKFAPIPKGRGAGKNDNPPEPPQQ